jgi:hypothetical protein
MTNNEIINAYIWAAKAESGAVPVLDLNKGDRFVWAGMGGHSNPVKVYCGRGWYQRPGVEKKFRTGMKTAVRKV